MRGHHQQSAQVRPKRPLIATSVPMPNANNAPFAFDAWMWRYIQAKLREQSGREESAPVHQFDEDRVEGELSLAWEFLKERKYYQAQQQCQEALEAIEHDLEQDFAHDLSTLTLFDDDDEERRECYLETLNVYQKVLLSQAVSLLLETDDIHDIDSGYDRYQELRRQIQREISKVAYLLGDDYDIDIFLISADLPHLDDLVCRHCRLLLKREFFRTFKIVIRTLGPLDRKDFHQVTEPYKNLRGLCEQCLDIIALMKDERFFGPDDIFIDKYEHDVKVYLQILWFLGLKSDLKKVDKFIHPNTYSGGQDTQTHTFSAIELLQHILPHLQQARAVGLSPAATADIVEMYAEHWYSILKKEEVYIHQDVEKPEHNAGRLQRIARMKAIIDQYTVLHTKTRIRVEFAHKFLKKTRMAFRLQDHRIVQVPNPDGRKVHDIDRLPEFLKALEGPLFTEFIQELRLQYRSRHNIKMQRLRWAWFAERKLPEGFFERLHYNYLDYIDDHWKEKLADHYSLLQQLAVRDSV